MAKLEEHQEKEVTFKPHLSSSLSTTIELRSFTREVNQQIYIEQFVGDLEIAVDTYTQVEVKNDHLRSANSQLIKDGETIALKLAELVQRLKNELKVLIVRSTEQEKLITTRSSSLEG